MTSLKNSIGHAKHDRRRQARDLRAPADRQVDRRARIRRGDRKAAQQARGDVGRAETRSVRHWHRPSRPSARRSCAP